DNLQTLFANVGIDLETQTWVYICAIITWIPLILLKSMKDVTFLSIMGAIASAVVVIVVLTTSIVEYPDKGSDQRDFINLKNLPFVIATFNFCFGGNIVFPNIESSMKNARDWSKVLTISIFIITLMYLLIGIPAYITYGRSLQSPIYLSLPPGPSATVAIIMITTHILLALPVYLTSFSMEIENLLIVQEFEVRRRFVWRVIIRSLIMAFTVLMAVNIPFASDLVELLGAAGNGMLLVVTPIILWVKLFGWQNLEFKEQCWIIFVLTFSIFGA
ncbi:10176_t:CDS:2, partial [Acaulospora morrowiae]